MILVTVRETEPCEKALRRFRRKVEREGIRKDIKKNSFYLKPGEKKPKNEGGIPDFVGLDEKKTRLLCLQSARMLKKYPL